MMSMSMRSDLLLTKSNPLWMRSWARVTRVVKLLRRPGKRVLDSRILWALSKTGVANTTSQSGFWGIV